MRERVADSRLRREIGTGHRAQRPPVVLHQGQLIELALSVEQVIQRNECGQVMARRADADMLPVDQQQLLIRAKASIANMQVAVDQGRRQPIRA